MPTEKGTFLEGKGDLPSPVGALNVSEKFAPVKKIFDGKATDADADNSHCPAQRKF